MRTTAIGLLLVFCLIGCEPDVDGTTQVHFYVRNDTAVTISMYAVSVETTLAYAGLAPAQRVRVGCQGEPFGDLDLRFFQSDSIVIKQGDTLLDTYRASDTRQDRDKHIMVRSDYEETSRTETDVEYTFGLFSE